MRLPQGSWGSLVGPVPHTPVPKAGATTPENHTPDSAGETVQAGPPWPWNGLNGEHPPDFLCALWLGIVPWAWDGGSGKHLARALKAVPRRRPEMACFFFKKLTAWMRMEFDIRCTWEGLSPES